MPEIRTEVEIDAPPDACWGVLSDFGRYSDWNPFLVRLTGVPTVGAPVVVRVASVFMTVNFHAMVLAATPNRELRWKGHLLSDGFVAAEHYFQIEPLGSARSRFIHGEIFSGAVANAAWGLIERDTRRGYERMNRAFKERVEKSRRGPVEPTVASTSE
jgi:hypothetical protein